MSHKSAFPYPKQILGSGQDYQEIPGSEGMSAEEFAAIFAPSDIPLWFIHKPPERTFPPYPSMNLDDSDDKKIVRDWKQDPCWDLPPHLQWFQKEAEAHNIAVWEWKEADQAARYFQWRKYFAENLFK